MRLGVRSGLSILSVVLLSAMVFAQSSESGKQSSQSSGGAESQIKALDEQQRQSALKGDASFMEQHLASDFVGVDGWGNKLTRDQVIQNRKTGAMKYQNIDLKDTKIRVYGNTAIVNHDAHVKGDFKGQRIDNDYRATFVWVKQGGQWKLASSSSTKVEGAPASAEK